MVLLMVLEFGRGYSALVPCLGEGSNDSDILSCASAERGTGGKRSSLTQCMGEWRIPAASTASSLPAGTAGA